MDKSAKVLEILEQYLDEPGKLSLDDNLLERGISSYNFLKIVVDLENEFDMEFDPEELNYNLFQTPATLIRCIEK